VEPYATIVGRLSFGGKVVGFDAAGALAGDVDGGAECLFRRLRNTADQPARRTFVVLHDRDAGIGEIGGRVVSTIRAGRA
jgi:hypothetical protein